MSFQQILNTRQLLSKQPSHQDWQYLQKIIQHLNGYLNQCTKNRQYIESQKAKQKITQYQRQMKRRSLAQVQDRLNDSLLEVDRKQTDEIKGFQMQWKRKANRVMQQFNEQLNKKIAKQQEEKNRYLTQLQTALPLNHSPDAQLHKLKWFQDQCVKQGKFLQAQKAKQKIQHRQDYLNQKHQKMRSNNIELMMKQLEQRHRRQIQSIQQKMKQKIFQVQNQQKKKRKQLELKHAKQIKQIKWIYNQQMKKYSVHSKQQHK